MKKNIFLFIVLGAAVFAGDVLAAPSYGTHMPGSRGWMWGFESSFILDRNLDNDQGAAKGRRYFLTGSFGLLPWLCLDAKIGVGDVEWSRNQGNDCNYNTNFAGGYGFRIKGPENKKLGLKSVTGFQHISVHPNADNRDGNKNETIIDEWQLSVLVSKDMGRFVPYAGGRYGTLDFIKWTNEADRKRIKSEKMYGVVAGMDLWLDDRTKLNVEGAFLDGEEFTVGISRVF